VPDDTQDAPRPFDVKTVEYLLRLMTDHDLSEVDLKEGDQRIRLRKGPVGIPMAFAPAAAAPVPQSHTAPPAGGSAPASPPPPPAASKHHEIKSELPGTFYTRPAPDKPEFVKVGSRVTPDTVVCYVSAMKLNNEVRAGVTGTIVEVVAKNDEFVDYGTVLFRVDLS
jgi:acetyl-CoA carboxylase biotin carboxyl carrier protein